MSIATMGRYAYVNLDPLTHYMNFQVSSEKPRGCGCYLFIFSACGQIVSYVAGCHMQMFYLYLQLKFMIRWVLTVSWYIIQHVIAQRSLLFIAENEFDLQDVKLLITYPMLWNCNKLCMLWHTYIMFIIKIF